MIFIFFGHLVNIERFLYESAIQRKINPDGTAKYFTHDGRPISRTQVLANFNKTKNKYQKLRKFSIYNSDLDPCSSHTSSSQAFIKGDFDEETRLANIFNEDGYNLKDEEDIEAEMQNNHVEEDDDFDFEGQDDIADREAMDNEDIEADMGDKGDEAEEIENEMEDEEEEDGDAEEEEEECDEDDEDFEGFWLVFPLQRQQYRV